MQVFRQVRDAIRKEILNLLTGWEQQPQRQELQFVMKTA